RVLTTNICGDSVYSSIYNFTAVSDTDNDGILDDVDNCVNTPNPDQADIDGNGIGDVCQDTDGDGVLDINDNCPTEANTDQADVDGNGIGDACQDTDSDGVLDINDNCPLTANTNQEDANNDGIGDICESVEPADTLTPNGDLQNDTWNIKNIEYVNNNTVKVFNRHGVKVFDASNYVNNTWGGESTEGGSGLLPAGSYYYVIEYTSSQGEAKVTKGWMYINY
ncbi:MAG: thrombospondin type 3 repeat-containing protein, partial [Flavobacteriaceae bacterium]|nr:thrombospondin type 3 repeat-containing protein [Flavobacteriaceae bacterium]